MTEKRVLRSILRGLSSREAAGQLFVSPRTIDNHKANIAAKLGTVGGPYSLARFVLLHQVELLRWLDLVEQE